MSIPVTFPDREDRLLSLFDCADWAVLSAWRNWLIWVAAVSLYDRNSAVTAMAMPSPRAAVM